MNNGELKKRLTEYFLAQDGEPGPRQKEETVRLCMELMEAQAAAPEERRQSFWGFLSDVFHFEGIPLLLSQLAVFAAACLAALSSPLGHYELPMYMPLFIFAVTGSGEAALDGQVGYMASEPGFWKSMTVLDNVGLPLMADGVTKWERRDAAMDALESVGLDYAAHTYPKSLSLGEQRLAALARALVKKPALLILTEPTSMLDEKETERFVDALTDRWKKDGSAVLFCGNGIIPADKTIYI